MALQRPKSMSELDYYTRRQIGNGKGEVWVFRQKCSCGGVFHKPKLRSPVYVCNKCGKEVSKADYQSKEIANVKYTCPSCKFESEKQEPFIRKKVGIMIKGKKKSVETFRFQCDKCKANIDVTKKMK